MKNQASENQVLQNFYHRALSLYTPQAEKFLDAAEPAAFSRVSFRYTFSVEAMTKISHIIEDATLANPRVTDLHVSFQYLSRLLPQKARYQKLADTVKGLWLYGAPDIDSTELASLARTTVVDTSDTPLTTYWFVVSYGPGIGMSLLAEEIPALEGADRYYEGFYTFEPDVAYQILSILHRIYPNRVPLPQSPEQFNETR